MDSELKEKIGNAVVSTGISVVVIELATQRAFQFNTDGTVTERDNREALIVLEALETEGVE